jgi:pSer/pThr/pTyr-binding forkhead associated (FHA) protein
MFALEIFFNNQDLPPEVVLIRRSSAIIGGEEFAHVVLDDMVGLGYHLRLLRGVGRSFVVVPIKTSTEGDVNEAEGDEVVIPSNIAGTYYGTTALNIGIVQLRITSLDLDCCIIESEPSDKACIRVLQRACKRPSPHYPALFVRPAFGSGYYPWAISIPVDVPMLVGRDRDCLMRFDNVDVSNHHARLGYEGGELWIEDLGSTNGTFIDGHQVSVRNELRIGQTVQLGQEVTFIPIGSDQQLEWILNADNEESVRSFADSVRYPIIISVSEVARPTRVVMPVGETLHVGRDPNNDMWLGAPHISRKHAAITFLDTSKIEVNDFSTNGILMNGVVIGKGNVADVANGQPVVLDFGAGVTIGICFDESHEAHFVESGGDVYAFSDENERLGRTITDKKMQSDQNLHLRSVTQQGIYAENSDVVQKSRRHFKRSALVIVVVCVVLLVVVLIELLRGPL